MLNWCGVAALEKEVPEYKDEYTADYQAKHQALVSNRGTEATRVVQKQRMCGVVAMCRGVRWWRHVVRVRT